MSRATRPPSRPLIVFELFSGLRSLGTIAWETGEWIRLAVRDREERAFLLGYFGGPASKQDAEDVRFKPEAMTRAGFEEACHQLRAERGYEVAPRPPG